MTKLVSFSMNIKIGVSNHHVHLTKEVLETLFGKGYELTPKRYLTQKGQYACEETVTLKKGKKVLEHVRIIGPCRKYTQVELLERDNEYFNLDSPVRKSGDLIGSETITIVGPKGEHEAVESTIIADRHIHMSASDLETFKRHNDEVVSVKVENGVTLDDVHIKSDESCVLEMHMNKDEAEKLGIETGMEVIIC